MAGFVEALSGHAFLQHAALAGLLAALPCGVVGAYVVARRLTYLAGAIAHSVLAGMGAARYLAVTRGWDWLTPQLGALAAALTAAALVGVVSLRARQREDTVIGAIWACGMALGVVFISQTPGYNVELMSYLFGNILMVSAADLWWLGGLSIVAVAVGAAFHRPLTAVCFDEQFARLRGLATDLHYLLLLSLTAVTVVVLSTVVGVVLVIALLTLPAGLAAAYGRSLGRIMAAAAVLTAAYTFGGLALSYTLDLPTGAVIILVAGAAYLLGVGVARLRQP